MPLLSAINFDPEVVSKALSSPESGLDTAAQDDFKDTLNNVGATPEMAALTIHQAMTSPHKLSGMQLKAAELVLECHEIRGKTGKVNNTPNINFIIKSDQVNINSIFNPSR